jgi:dTDP-4-dehydrorhamnose reductase
MSVYIFGSNGMLGTYLTTYLKNFYNTIPLTRQHFNISETNFSEYDSYFKDKLNSDDIIINAAGIIKQKSFTAKDLISVNSLFPHILAELKNKYNCNVIHVTTDCVFSGLYGNYNENNLHDCTDDYGKSKSLGESSLLTNIRTSIIGEENQGKKSLLEWCRSNKNKQVYGFLNHTWNGVSCLELAKIIQNIISNNLYWNGTKHIFSPNVVNKYELVKCISDTYDLNLSIETKNTEKHCYRTLSTIYNHNWTQKTVQEQVQDLYNYKI